MTEILPDRAIDRAEAFRLAKSYRLPPEIALNSDPSVLAFDLFTSCYSINDYTVIRRIRTAKLAAGMMAAISQSPSISYADRLSHFTERGAPVSFVDLRGALPGPAPGGSPPSFPYAGEGRGLPEYPPVAPAEPETGTGGPSARSARIVPGQGANRRRPMGGAPCPPEGGVAYPAPRRGRGQTLSKPFPARKGAHRKGNDTMSTAYGTTLDEYDCIRDASHISSMARYAELEEATGIIERQAVSNALLVHPVTRFVLRSPFESTMYPAISGSYVSLSKQILGRKARIEYGRCKRKADLTDFPNMVWSLPGRSSGSASCGVVKPAADDDVKPKASKGIPVKMCTSDPKHYMRAVSNHCGSLRCPKCANWTAMQTAIRIEERICTPADIQGRKDGFFDAPKHWAISPPQEWMKGIMQRSDHFSALVDDLCALLPAYGLYAGVLICHPWRLSEDATEWIFSPHFHAVGYGHFRNMDLRADLADADSRAGGIWSDDGRTESWVFNQIHPDEPIRSVRHTLGYILTHAGLGTFDHDVDWTDAADRISIPIESGKGNSADVAKTIAPYMVRGDAWREYGYYGEHPDELDWLQWTEDQLAGSIPTYRVFGSVHKVRMFSDHKERVPRLCPDCGQPIGLYHGVKSLSYDPVAYNRSSRIRVMRDDLEEVRRAWEQHSEELRAAGLDDLDFAVSVPQCSTPETKGLQDLERLRTPEQLQQRYDRRIAYVPSKYGMGYDPVVLTRKQYGIFIRTGLLPDDAEWNDSVRSEPFRPRAVTGGGSVSCPGSGPGTGSSSASSPAKNCRRSLRTGSSPAPDRILCRIGSCSQGDLFCYFIGQKEGVVRIAVVYPAGSG